MSSNPSKVGGVLNFSKEMMLWTTQKEAESSLNHPFSGATLQEINISHLGKRNIIFKMDFWGDMLVPRRVIMLVSGIYTHTW